VHIRPKTTPIYQTSVFTFDGLSDLEDYFGKPGNGYMYSRFGNPNAEELANEVVQLEGGEAGVATSSGMSAILAAVLCYCQAGDHLLCAEDIYGGSSTLLAQELTRLGIEVSFVPQTDLYTLESYCKPTTRMFLAETLSNPLLQVFDISRAAQSCKAVGIKLVIDNTFATPVLTKPLALGADMVLHSVTKYLSGHSDVTAGVVVAGATDGARLQQIMVRLGLNLSPFESWLAARGLKTLLLRVRQHSSNGMAVAKFLKEHPKVKDVYYPGLDIHPHYALAKEQGQGMFGGMLSFRIADNEAVVERFMQGLQHIPFAPSLAGVTTSVSHPLRTSHRFLSPEGQAALSISMGLVRLSVGIEEPQHIIADLAQALDAL
jgi:cystathionine beta-lyase/cystathionine gamma-synthase